MKKFTNIEIARIIGSPKDIISPLPSLMEDFIFEEKDEFREFIKNCNNIIEDEKPILYFDIIKREIT